MILVADDVDFIRNSMIEIVKKVGNFEVRGFKKGRELVEFYKSCLIEKRVVHLIILDLLMPIMSGMKSIREIRKLDCVVPIVLFSGLLSESVFKEAYTMGIRHIINKPINEEQANKIIKKYISRIQ